MKEAVAGLSHDLRTPLTALIGYLDLLEQEENGETVRRYLSQIRNQMCIRDRARTLEASGTSEGGGPGSSGLVNLNTAGKEALMTLSGIGESKAEDIIRYREESGGFKKIEDIMKVPGIKNAGFQKIKDRITV